MPRTKKHNTKYSPEFKLSVIIDMREQGFSFKETVRKYGLGDPKVGGSSEMLKRWERIYLEEGAAGFSIERRGRKRKVDNSNKGRPRKKPLPAETEKDLIDEVQQLRERNKYLEMENEYLKKLDALVRAEEQKNGRKPK